MSFMPCRRCKGVKSIPDGFFRSTITADDGTVYQTVVECDCHKKWRKETADKRKFKNSGFNESLFNYSLKDYIGKDDSDVKKGRVSNYLKLFLEDNEKVKSALVYFYGPNGTQKTTIANYIGAELIRNGKTCFYISFKNLIDLLWKSQMDEESQDKIETILKKDLIIIDESFDNTKAHIWKSGAQIGVIDNFIRERLTSQKGIIFISNVNVDNISIDVFGQSLVDLIKRETTLKKSIITFEDKYVALIGMPPEDLF